MKNIEKVYENIDDLFLDENVDIVYICKSYEGELKCQKGEVENLKFFDISDLPDNGFKYYKVIFKALSNDVLFNMIEDKNDLDKSLACILSNNINEINSLLDSDNFIKCRDLFLEFVNLKKSKDAVIYFVNNNHFFSKDDNLDMLFKWLIAFIESAILAENNDDNLIIKGIYDTIISYQKSNKGTLKYKLEVVLDLYSRLRYNITAKNLLHELVIKLI